MPKLSPIQQKFILHWGEMGTRWGINRTVAQIHALLFISAKPLHVLGDKRDHFESMKDVWEMFRVVLDERKKREIDPTLAMLRHCVAEAEKDKQTDQYTEQKLRELAEFFETSTAWYGQIRQWPTEALTRFAKMGDKIRKLLGIGGG